MLKTVKRIKLAFNPGIHQADLVTILRGLARTHLSRSRIESFRSLMHWLSLPVTDDEIHSRNVRFKFLMQFLERNPEETKYFVEFIFDYTRRGLGIRLLSLTGVSENSGFFSEVRERLAHHIFPVTYFEHDLATIFQVVFQNTMDARWVEESYEIIFPPLMKLLRENLVTGDDLLLDLQDAMIIVTSQIASIGTHKEIRRRLESTNLASSHFIRLGRLVSNNPEVPEGILSEISFCRDHLQRLRLSLEMTGVSVDLIYQMEKLSSLLDRLETLVYLQWDQTNKQQQFAHFLGGLIREEIKRTGVREFLKSHLHLLTRKVVERAGEKGDFYIASTSEEKSHLLNAGAWAGVLTSFAALFKTLIQNIHLPYLIEGIFFFINYSIIFLTMQKWHLALSSKLPAYTAAALSRNFEAFKKNRQIYDVVSEIQKIFKSQMIAAFGNIIWVVAVCIIIDWAWYFSFSQHLLSPQEAITTINKHGLLTSGTVFYSFITGIFLWISSLMAGAVESWLVFVNFTSMIKESALFNRLLDKKKLDHLAKSLPATLGSMAGNLFISALLAFPHVLGKITGLPLDIRHVTLSTGSITFAFNALNWDFTLWPLMVSMALSILVMGTLNFGVSFYCALQLAATSQDLERRHLKILLRYVFLKDKNVK